MLYKPILNVLVFLFILLTDKRLSDKLLYMKLNELTIKQAQTKLADGEISSLDLTKACLDRIAEVNEKLNVCLTVFGEEALASAKEADKRLANGERTPLLGIPFLAKDNILAKGQKTTAASKMLENYVAPYDATVVAKLKKAGAVLLGKTNLDEFAHGASTEYSAYGPTKNPYDLTRVPGGSSGGSAVAVATNMCLFALGTDTGGSVRHPASFCGVVGFKPSYGACSRFGLIAMTSSTDVPGVLAKTADDAWLVVQAMAGQDKHDGTTIDFDFSNTSKTKNKNSLKGLRIGVAKEYFDKGLNKQAEVLVLSAIEELKKLGAEIVPISLPNTIYGVSVYYIITPSEISSNLARFDGLRYGLKTETDDLSENYLSSRGRGFGAEVKRRVMLGTYALSSGYYDAYYIKAQAVRAEIIKEFAGAFDQVDLIATPATPSTAFHLGEQNQDPLKMYLEDVFLTPSSLAGLPAVSLPAGLIDDLPIGWQLIGAKGADDLVLSVAEIYQTKVKTEQPKLQV